ncbi:MAG: hypothetical protein DRN01_01310 [Thermoplasmata archaeon]|nr:MAG: hypothetical protein DRN01_01310 [Thermoplasmata archaeon]
MLDLTSTMKIAKSYLFDRDLTRKLGRERIKKYQDKALKKVVECAFKTKFYREKYREKGLNPSDIKGLEDIDKLPIVTRDDFVKASPNDLLPETINVKKIFQASTSGSTGQPLVVWNDTYTALRCLQGFAEELSEHGVNWRKDKITIIGDFSPGGPENAYLTNTFFSGLNLFFNTKNFQTLDVKEDALSLMQKISRFKPDFIGGYPPMLKGLAFLKKNGYGETVKPKCIATSGTLLDKKTRDFIEEAFNVKLFDVYSSTEAGTVAFQCREGRYHVHSELVHVELLGRDGEPVDYGERGSVVVTRLYGEATPVLRYIGMNDTAKNVEVDCVCGRETPLISEIEGRRCDPVFTLDGRILSPFYFTSIICSYVKKGLNVERFQIVQNSLDEMEILVAVESNQWETYKKHFEGIEKDFKYKLGEHVEIKIKQVKKLENNVPVVLSKVEGLK